MEAPQKRFGSKILILEYVHFFKQPVHILPIQLLLWQSAGQPFTVAYTAVFIKIYPRQNLHDLPCDQSWLRIAAGSKGFDQLFLR